MKTARTIALNFFLTATVAALFLLLSACGAKQDAVDAQTGKPDSLRQIPEPQFQALLDSVNLTGGIFIFDPVENAIWSNDFSFLDQGQLPASTYKIPNSMIALETGVVEDENTLFKWDGKKRRLKQWEQDLNFHDAFHLSCVPCYQDIARRVGVERMKKFIAQFQYGNMRVDSASIDRFWLQGESKISPRQQIEFLQRFHDRQLGLSARTDSLMRDLIVIQDSNGYRLSGKTGWAVRDSSNTGWFVGFVEQAGHTRYFASLLFPGPDFDMDQFASIRREVTLAALCRMKWYW